MRQQTGRGTASPGSQCTGDPSEGTQQVNKTATDMENTAESSQGLNGDLERLTMNEKACENCLVGKKNAARQNR